MASARVAIFNGPNKAFELAEVDLPSRLNDGEVLVAIDLATICGSDLHTFEGRRTGHVPSVLGHEGVGRIAAHGIGREAWRIGDRVTWSLADSCGQCQACAEYDLPQKCSHLFKYGHASLSEGAGLSGCYASHILLRPGTHLTRVPHDLPDPVTAPANCALATMIAATEDLPRPCRIAVVQGAGLLGIYACALLKSKGVERVIVVDTDAQRLAPVPEFGGEPACASALDRIQPGQADAVFEVAGVSAVVKEGITLLRPGGFYALVGMVHRQTPLEITGESVIRGCVTLRGYHNYAPRHLDAAIQFLSAHRDVYPWANLVSAPWPLTRLDEAFAEAAARRWHRVAVTAIDFTENSQSRKLEDREEMP